MNVWVLVLIGILNGQGHVQSFVFKDKQTCEAMQAKAVTVLTGANYDKIGSVCVETKVGTTT